MQSLQNLGLAPLTDTCTNIVSYHTCARLSADISPCVCSFINGLKAQGTKTKDAKVLFYGAGSSAVGVANMIASLIEKDGGLSAKEAKEVCPPHLFTLKA